MLWDSWDILVVRSLEVQHMLIQVFIHFLLLLLSCSNDTVMHKQINQAERERERKRETCGSQIKPGVRISARK